MNVIGIAAYRAASAAGVSGETGGPAQPHDGSFGDVLNRAMKQLEGLQANADAATLQLVSGQPVEIHEAMLAMEEASLGLQLAVQVRNKVMEAYQEIMRTQV